MNLTKTKEILERLVSIHQEIDTLNEEIKDIKEVVDEELEEVKFADLNKIAKLRATSKLGETVTKMENFVELVDAVSN